ncbi:MAG: T9SS type A sorting domain-containing protein [Bacteroidetes bacterium]|nr:T9SS type A sorting domain-containing protein [Bacteroidota bacterium]
MIRLESDILPGAAASFPRNLVVYGRQLYFIAVGSLTDGYQLFRFNDSTGVTEQVVPATYLPNACTDDDMDHYSEPCIALGSLYFPATYDSIGTEMYKIQSSLIGIEEQPGSFFFDVYPDPASSIITINLYDEKNTAQVTIYNMEGKALLSEHFNEVASFDVSNFSSGIYAIRVITSHGSRIKKIVIR